MTANVGADNECDPELATAVTVYTVCDATPGAAPEKADPDAVNVSPAGTEEKDQVAPLRLVDRVPVTGAPTRTSAAEDNVAVAVLPKI